MAEQPEQRASSSVPSDLLIAAVRQAFEFGFECGRKGSRTVVTDDGLIDGSAHVVLAAIAAIAEHTEAAR